MKRHHDVSTRTSSRQTVSRQRHLLQSALPMFMGFAAATLCGRTAEAASATWIAAPTDASWSVGNNWSTAAVPGAINASTSTDVATFSQSTTYGLSASPLIVDSGRTIGTLSFDTGSASPYVIGSAGGNALRLGTAVATGSISVSATVTNAQAVNAPLVLLGTNGTQSFANDSSTTSTVLTIGGAIAAGATNTASTDILTLKGANTGVNTISGNIGGGAGGAIAIVKSGTGTWVLSGTNTYTGLTTIQQGTLSLSSLNSVVGGTSSSSLGAPITATNGTIAVGNGATTGQLTYTNTTADETTDRIIKIGGSGAGSGGAILDQSGTHALKFTSNFTVNGAGTGNTRTLTLQGSTVGTGEIAGIAGIGTGTLALNKLGSGQWTLSGTNGYNGMTTVSQGVLSIAATGKLTNTSSVSIGAGEFSYNSTTALAKPVAFSGTGGQLSGSGTIGTAVTVTAGNSLAPAGNSIGTLSFGDALTLAGTNDFEIQASDLTSDLANATGALTYGGTLKITNLSGTLAAGQSWSLFDFGSESGLFANDSVFGTAGDGTNLPDLGTGLTWSFDYGSGQLSITSTSVPEPATVAMAACLGGLGLLRSRRHGAA